MRSGSERLPRLVFRADAGAEAGIGHAARSLALALAWRARGGEALFAARGLPGALAARLSAAGVEVESFEAGHPHPADLERTLSLLGRAGPGAWLVVDGYRFDGGYHAAVRRAGYRVLAIDDQVRLSFYDAEVVLNPNVHADRLAYECGSGTLLLGPRYALLRPEFSRRAARSEPERARRVLVTFGGSDPENATLRAIEGLRLLADRGLEVKVVVGPANPRPEALARAAGPFEVLRDPPDMARLMTWAHVAVAGGGTSAYELACMGVPALLLAAAENQEEVAEGLARFGAAKSLGRAAEASPARIAAEAAELLADRGLCREMGEAGRALVDGRGAERVAALLAGGLPATARLELRRATEEDAGLLWWWANDPLVRANSFSPSPIAWSEHRAWYRSALASPRCRMYILEAGGVPAGQARYERGEDGVARAGFSLGAGFRGRRLAARLLELSADRAARELGAREVEGIVFAENLPSARAFARAGFRIAGRRRIGGRECLVFRRMAVEGVDAASA